MKRENFTADRVAGFECKQGAKQSIFWDGKTPGLGLRVTAAGSKSYIFETRLNGQTIRITIGDTRTWAIGKAQAEATRLKVMTDQNIDPRQVRADKEAARIAERQAKEAEAAALAAQQARESVTVGTAWLEYIEARKPQWSERHYRDHVTLTHPGGIARSRSADLTKPGPLAALLTVRLIDMTPERVEAWAKVEAATRPTRARLSLRLLKAFLNWCAEHPAYKEAVTSNAAKSKAARESLGKAKVKNDVLQREQLPAWFAAVKKIGNPVISAYLQGLLLTGARRNELAALKWQDVDFQWNSMTIRDKMEGLRVIPLTPYVAHLLAALPRRNAFVFSSPTAASGRIEEPRIAHGKACAIAGVDVTLHGLRRSFASLCEWTETPAGIAAQIQGHAPQGVREQNYIRRSLDLLRMWHVKIEAWILEQSGIEFVPVQAGLRVVNNDT
ncbi:MAG: tyrosine-type recombinase/integrase [Ferrovum sp.]|jgi:integrase|nr:tyrosine-type recombinase/integrase [Ferrovum sp.]